MLMNALATYAAAAKVQDLPDDGEEGCLHILEKSINDVNRRREEGMIPTE